MSRYATDRFLAYLYDSAPKGQDLECCTAEEFPALCQKKREELRGILGLDKLEQIPVQVQMEKEETERYEGFTLQNYDFTFLPELTAPVYVLSPDQPNGKAILYMNGHGPGVKTQLVSDNGTDPFALQLVRHGYTLVTPELVGFGEMLQEENATENHRGCIGNAVFMLMNGMTLAGLRVLECRRLLDWFTSTHSYTALGSYGMSGGGMLNTLMMALEDRIDAACIANYPNTFRESILAMHHCVCNYYPGILEVGEIAHLIALGAPRPVLLSCGDHDPIFPKEGSIRCYETLSALYDKIGAKDLVEMELFDGEHEISNAVVFDFFARTL